MGVSKPPCDEKFAYLLLLRAIIRVLTNTLKRKKPLKLVERPNTSRFVPICLGHSNQRESLDFVPQSRMCEIKTPNPTEEINDYKNRWKNGNWGRGRGWWW